MIAQLIKNVEQVVIGKNEIIEKTYWYAILSMLQEIKKYYEKGDYQEMNQEILQLKRIYIQ